MVHDLAVDKVKVPGRKLLREPRHRDLAGIVNLGKHRLPKKQATERDAVEAADQLTTEKCLDGVCEARFVKCRIGLLHLGENPGS